MILLFPMYLANDDLGITLVAVKTVTLVTFLKLMETSRSVDCHYRYTCHK